MADGAMALAHAARLAEARASAYATPLDQFQAHAIEHFTSDTLWPWFERLRAEDPVHYTAESEYGPYWSVTRYADIVACESDVARLSSSRSMAASPSSSRRKPPTRRSAREERAQLHLARSAAPRRPAQGGVADLLDPLAGRAGAADPLARRPRSSTSCRSARRSTSSTRSPIELTSQMLATLFDFPFEQRRMLPRFSDFLLSGPADTVEENQAPPGRDVHDAEPVRAALERAARRQPDRPRPDLAAGQRSGHRRRRRSAELHEQHHPADRRRLRHHAPLDHRRPPGAQPAPGRVRQAARQPRRCSRAPCRRSSAGRAPSPTCAAPRWTTSRSAARPSGRARRSPCGTSPATATRPPSSAPNEFIIDRARPRQHAGFGFGIHRCLGQRLAEMQLRVVWEEMLKRFPVIEVVGEPTRLQLQLREGLHRTCRCASRADPRVRA